MSFFCIFLNTILFIGFNTIDLLHLETGEENTPYFVFANKIKEVMALDKLTEFNLNIKTKEVNSIKNILNVNNGKYGGYLPRRIFQRCFFRRRSI